jgi:seryl-tRNA synthetase
MMKLFRRFVSAIYTWKQTLILERIYHMSATLDQLAVAVDSLLAKEASAQQLVAAANAEKDKAVADLADAVKKAEDDSAALQKQIDDLTAKINAAP